MNTVKKFSPKEGKSTLQQELGRVLMIMNQRRQATMAAFQVNEVECDIIAYLDDNESKKMKEVGEHFGIKLSTLTSTIDKLENLRLVKRKNSREDRRVIYIQTTNRGKDLLSQLDGIFGQVAETMAQSLSADQIDACIQAMSKV